MIVVTGATGNVGRPLVKALNATGEQVTAVSRHPGAMPDGVRHHRADLAEPESLLPVLDGADAVFVLIPGVGNPKLLDVMKGAGRVVLLSSQSVGTRPDAPLREFEDAAKGIGPEWTVLRAGGFHTNAFAWAESIRTQRVAAAPFGDVGLPSVDPEDIAEAAATALTGDGHAGRTYELTGPTPISPRQKARAIGDVLGEPVRFVEQSRAEAREQMLGFMPPVIADSTLDILGAPTQDELRVSPDVERLLQRPPRAFGEWAERNAAAFR